MWFRVTDSREDKEMWSESGSIPKEVFLPAPRRCAAWVEGCKGKTRLQGFGADTAAAHVSVHGSRKDRRCPLGWPHEDVTPPWPLCVRLT